MAESRIALRAIRATDRIQQISRCSCVARMK